MNLTVLRLLLFVTAALAGFTQLSCTSKNECVAPRDGGGGFCYDPKQSNRTRHTSCTEENFDLSKIMVMHIGAKSSINYYDLYDWERLGDYTYMVTKPSYWCLSGRMTDGSYQSMCGYTSRDNVIQNIYCTLGIGQPYVEDGCYTPDTSTAAVQYVATNGTSGAYSTYDSSAPTPTTGPSRNDAARLSSPLILVLLPFLTFVGLVLHSL